MASITKRRDGYRVRWREPDGRTGSRQCPDLVTAKNVKIEVERALAAGRRWEPRGVREVPSVEVVLTEFLKDYARKNEVSSAVLMGRTFDVFLRWLDRHRRRGEPVRVDVLSKTLLADFYDALAAPNQHGRKRSKYTLKRMVQRIQAAWAWAANEDEYMEFVPRPRTLPMGVDPGKLTVAPTWEEMDRCIAAATGPTKQLAIVLRFTGLRVQQAMRLRWGDVDLKHHLLMVRRDLGKTLQEKKGRVIPLSGHLIKELETWEHRDGWLVPSNRTGKDARLARQRSMRRAWKRANVRPEVWTGESHHSFRNGFVSGLKRLKADDEAVEYLVGHSLGLRGLYTDAAALPLREAVDLIPPLSPSGDVVSFESAGAEAVRRSATAGASEADDGVRDGVVCPYGAPLQQAV